MLDCPFDAGLPRAQYGSFDYSIGTNYEVFDYAQRPFPSVPFLRAHHNNVTDGRCVSLSGCLGTVFLAKASHVLF